MVALMLIAVATGGAVALRWRGRLIAAIERAERETGQRSPGGAAERIDAAVDALLVRPAANDSRSPQSHAVSGLPTREPLMARMTADGRGTLALLACKDYDRLCAFDPVLAERVLLTIVERLSTMLPPERFVAHVDRAHLAVWIGPEVEGPGAAAELEALVYALGDRVTIDDRDILPDIILRSARFDAAVCGAKAALSRTLASFAVPGAAGGTQQLDPQSFARERFLIEQDLRQAVARGELRLHFQPLIDAGEGRVCGAEALLRWQHPTRGLVPPSRFIPVMEAAGLAQEIGMWVLNAALREARNWRSMGLHGLRVAVNVSGQQLDVSDLPLLVERTLARHALGADALEIELTESIAMGDGDRAASLFDSLRALGVRIAIDDFGTGYSSFSALRTLSFDKIKIDREFVTDVDRRADSQAICNSMLALGRGLGTRVLAEGVEASGEYGWLRRQGCVHFQGFYFSPPLEAAAFVDFVRDLDGLARLLAVPPAEGGHQNSERLRA